MKFLQKITLFSFLMMSLGLSAQLEVKSAEHSEKLYSHSNGSLELVEHTKDSLVDYVFYFHDLRNPATEKRTEFKLADYAELRQFLDLAINTVRSNEEVETEKYKIKSFHHEGISQAWIYLPDGAYFHITEAIYIQLDKGLEER